MYGFQALQSPTNKNQCRRAASLWGSVLWVSEIRLSSLYGSGRACSVRLPGFRVVRVDRVQVEKLVMLEDHG